jgi:hypothetical protein
MKKLLVLALGLLAGCTYQTVTVHVGSHNTLPAGVAGIEALQQYLALPQPITIEQNANKNIPVTASMPEKAVEGLINPASVIPGL